MSIVFLFLFLLCLSSDSHASLSAQGTNAAEQDANASTHPVSPDARNKTFPFNKTALPLPLNAIAHNPVRDAATYRKYVGKGINLYSQLRGGCEPDKEKPLTIKDLIGTNWDISPFPVLAGDRSSSGLLPDIFDMIGFGKGKDYFFINALNRQTHSKYRSSYSPANGLIAAIELAHIGNDPVFWSDVGFAMWTHVCECSGNQPTNLKYLVQAYIMNDITLAIMNEAIPQHTGIFEFTPDGDRAEGFFAFLASPNGVGGAYLLMQHKVALGRKTVTKITVLKEGFSAPDIVYEIGEAEVRATTMAVSGPMVLACGAWNTSLIVTE